MFKNASETAASMTFSMGVAEALRRAEMYANESPMWTFWRDVVASIKDAAK